MAQDKLSCLYLTTYRQLGSQPPWETTEKDLRLLKQRLKINLPTDWPVRYRRCTLRDGSLGDCELIVSAGSKLPYFTIRVDKRLPRIAQWLVIAHEYAHCLQQRGPAGESTRLDDHDGEFALAYTRVWQEIAE
jgi:hypothetical protein